MKDSKYIYSISQLKEEDFNVNSLVDFISKIEEVDIAKDTEEFQYDHLNYYLRKDEISYRNKFEDLEYLNESKLGGFLRIKRIR